jgi:fumarate reductase flavoprotein subunit
MALCAAAPRYVEWLADQLDYPIELGLDMPRSGQSVPRLHADRGRRGGPRLAAALRSAVSDSQNIVFVDECPGTGLIVEDDAVIGLTVDEHGTPKRIRAGAVVLGTDGFAANTDMMARHCPDGQESAYWGVSTSTGDAIEWATRLGASTKHMGAFLASGLVVPGHGTRINPALPFLGAILVNEEGRRFVDETKQGYSALGQLITGQPGGRAAIFWDEASMDVVRETHLMRESAASGAYRQYESLEAAATALGLPEEELGASLGGRAPRDVPGEAPALTFPLYGAWVTRGLLATQGGLEVDPCGRVLRSGGQAIDGLYAGGGTAVGISGPSSTGYSSGNGLMSALGFGWIIGNRLAGGSS